MRLTPEQFAAWRPDNKHLAHYIAFYGNMLPTKTCEDMIEAFDANPHLQVERNQGGDHFRFKQLDVTEHSNQEPWLSIHKSLFETTQRGLLRYVDDIYFDDSPRFPEQFGLEHFRINKTMNNGRDGFGRHTDVGDYPSARRFITILYYLNTIEEGGDADFPICGFSVKPTQGSMLIFPSTWQYLHAGLKPISDPKYICTCFTHYC